LNHDQHHELIPTYIPNTVKTVLPRHRGTYKWECVCGRMQIFTQSEYMAQEEFEKHVAHMQALLHYTYGELGTLKPRTWRDNSAENNYDKGPRP